MTNRNPREVVLTVASQITVNGAVDRKNKIKRKTEQRRMNDSNRQNNQSTTPNLYAKDGCTEQIARDCRNKLKLVNIPKVALPRTRREIQKKVSKGFQKNSQKHPKQVNKTPKQLAQMTSSDSEEKQSLKKTGYANRNKKLKKYAHRNSCR